VKSEYAATAHAAETIWLQYLLKDLRIYKYEPTILLCDNQGAISLAKNPIHHTKIKHVDIQLHFIRDYIEKGTINVKYHPTKDMLADLMTKGFACETHTKLLGMIRMETCEVLGTTMLCSLEPGLESTSAIVELRTVHAAR
jgi:hypothetical protein